MSRWNAYYRFYKIAPSVYICQAEIFALTSFVSIPHFLYSWKPECAIFTGDLIRGAIPVSAAYLIFFLLIIRPLLPTLLLSLPSRESRKIISLCWPVTSEVCKAEAVLYTVQYSAIEGDFADILDSAIWKTFKYVLLISWLRYALLLQIEPRCNYNYNWEDV